jgi:hypothetical protein
MMLLSSPGFAHHHVNGMLREQEMRVGKHPKARHDRPRIAVYIFDFSDIERGNQKKIFFACTEKFSFYNSLRKISKTKKIKDRFS